MLKIVKRVQKSIHVISPKTRNFTVEHTEAERAKIREARKHEHLEFQKLLENNKAWSKKIQDTDPDFFSDRANRQQTPNYLFIGCSDSRVPAEQITGLQSGDIFVHRNIANLVVNSDMNSLSVIQYAVQVLKVKHIIVCGHYGCGGCLASMQNQDLGLIENWLRNIRDVIRMHSEPGGELDGITDEEARRKKVIELNVREQCLNLLKNSYVQDSLEHTGFPILHGLVYDIHDGILKELPIDFKELQVKYSGIYSLQKSK
jgi:carbonic anhydrase